MATPERKCEQCGKRRVCKLATRPPSWQRSTERGPPLRVKSRWWLCSDCAPPRTEPATEVRK